MKTQNLNRLALQNLTNTHIAKLYGLRAEQLQNIPYPPAYALNIVVDRIVIAVTPGDRDVYGAQQQGLLLDLKLCAILRN